jgi:hypothetical protein
MSANRRVGLEVKVCNKFQPCFLAVERTVRMTAKSFAPHSERNPPEIFWRSFIMRPSRSARLLVKGRVIFALPRDIREVQLVSRAQAPTEARPWLNDQRRLGIRAKRIVLRGAGEMREVPMDHPDRARGWWAVEQDGPMMSRWTDGEAMLPLPAMRGHVVLEIHLAGAMTFVEETVPVGGLERRAAA